jgi:GNAT superfamily N-acetyltransferase
VLGIKDENTLIICNSWSGWKDDPIGYLSREYFDRYGQEGSISRIWNRGPTAATAEALLRGDNAIEFRKFWRSGRRWGVNTNVGGRKDLRFKWYECWSLQEEVPAEFLVLELNGHIRVAAAVLVHHSNVSDLSELFVWPNYRHRGYGSLLEELAEDRSRQAGAQEIGIYVWNADVMHGSDRAEGFLASRGYAMEQFEQCQAVMYGKRKIR